MFYFFCLYVKFASISYSILFPYWYRADWAFLSQTLTILSPLTYIRTHARTQILQHSHPSPVSGLHFCELLPLSAGRRERSIRLYVVLDTDSDCDINNSHNSNNNRVIDNNDNTNHSSNQGSKETASSHNQIKNTKDNQNSDFQYKESLKSGQPLVNTNNFGTDSVGNKGVGVRQESGQGLGQGQGQKGGKGEKGQKGEKGGNVDVFQSVGRKGENLLERGGVGNGTGGIIVFDTTILISPPPPPPSSSSSSSSSSSTLSSVSYASSSFLTLAVHRRYESIESLEII